MTMQLAVSLGSLQNSTNKSEAMITQLGKKQKLLVLRLMKIMFSAISFKLHFIVFRLILLKNKGLQKDFIEMYADREKIFDSILLNKLEGFYSDLGWTLSLNPYREMFFNFDWDHSS